MEKSVHGLNIYERFVNTSVNGIAVWITDIPLAGAIYYKSLFNYTASGLSTCGFSLRLTEYQ